MSEEAKAARRGFRLGRTDWIFLAIIGVLALASAALTILQRSGLAPVEGAVALYLPLFALTALLIWGIVVLRRVIRRPMLRRVLTWVLGALLLFLFARTMTYAGYVAAVSLPHRYSAITSPSGAHTLLVMRTLDSDQSRFDARRDARRAADPDAGEDYVAEDMGYVYTAYPPALGGLFYRSDADVEGEVCLAYTGAEGTMMVEWLDDETVAHFYVDNPGTAEGGEMFVRF